MLRRTGRVRRTIRALGKVAMVVVLIYVVLVILSFTNLEMGGP